MNGGKLNAATADGPTGATPRLPQPSIGRVVHYTQPQGELEYNGQRTHPAIITTVHGDGPDAMVNLKVFFDCGPVEDRTSVYPRHHVLAGEDSGYWDWPPRV